MSIKDLINSAFEKDASSFEKTFEEIMDEKMDSTIASKYNEMFGSSDLDEGYKKKMKEEDEEDDDEEDEDEEDED